MRFTCTSPLDAGIADTDVESLHECIPSDFDLERLAMDTVLMGELKQALKAWKPWAEELLELYLAGAKRFLHKQSVQEVPAQ